VRIDSVLLQSERWRCQYWYATYQRQSNDWGRRALSFVRLALKVVVQNDGDFM